MEIIFRKVTVILWIRYINPYRERYIEYIFDAWDISLWIEGITGHLIVLVLDLLVRQLLGTGVIVQMEKELQNKLRKYFILQVIAIIVNFCISFQNSRQDSEDDVMT